MPRDMDALSSAWIAEHQRDGTEVGDASEILFDLPREEPEEAWLFIVHALSIVPAEPANPAFQSLAAGPLEDLLGYHGTLMIERVETLARRNPAFNLLLGGVWQGSMSREIWSRIESCRLTVW